MVNDNPATTPTTHKIQRIAPQLVFDAMEGYGGGFVRHLAQAWRRADPSNSAKLHEAFAEYYAQYESAAKRDLERNQ